MTDPAAPALQHELNRLGVLPLVKPKPAPQGPIRVVRSDKDVNW